MNAGAPVPEPDPTTCDVSPYAGMAVRRKIERDNLRAMIQANEEIHGSLTPEEIQAAREEIYGVAPRRPARSRERDPGPRR